MLSQSGMRKFNEEIEEKTLKVHEIEDIKNQLMRFLLQEFTIADVEHIRHREKIFNYFKDQRPEATLHTFKISYPYSKKEFMYVYLLYLINESILDEDLIVTPRYQNLKKVALQRQMIFQIKLLPLCRELILQRNAANSKIARGIISSMTGFATIFGGVIDENATLLSMGAISGLVALISLGQICSTENTIKELTERYNYFLGSLSSPDLLFIPLEKKTSAPAPAKITYWSQIKNCCFWQKRRDNAPLSREEKEEELHTVREGRDSETSYVLMP